MYKRFPVRRGLVCEATWQGRSGEEVQMRGEVDREEALKSYKDRRRRPTFLNSESTQ